MNLVVTTYQQNMFCVAGATLVVENMSTVVYVSLSGDNRGRVRGHFERIWTRSDVEEMRAAWFFECELKAERERTRVAAAERVAKQSAEEANQEKEEKRRKDTEDKRTNQDHDTHVEKDAEDEAKR